MKWRIVLQPIDGKRGYGIGEFSIDKCEMPPVQYHVDETLGKLKLHLNALFGRVLGYAYMKHLVKDGDVGVEIGVDYGDGIKRFLETGLSAIDAVDPWLATSKEKGNQDAWTDVAQKEMDERHSSVVETYGDNPRVNIHRMTSDEYFAQVKENSLDWAYIDGSHHANQLAKDLQGALRAVKTGGWVAIDDCYSSAWAPEIGPLVRDFARASGAELISNAFDPWIFRLPQ